MKADEIGLLQKRVQVGDPLYAQVALRVRPACAGMVEYSHVEPLRPLGDSGPDEPQADDSQRGAEHVRA